jgi:hypothetical protein
MKNLLHTKYTNKYQSQLQTIKNLTPIPTVKMKLYAAKRKYLRMSALSAGLWVALVAKESRK